MGGHKPFSDLSNGLNDEAKPRLEGHKTPNDETRKAMEEARTISRNRRARFSDEADDIAANWRDDPLEDTPPVRGAFRGLLSRLTDEQRNRLRESYQEDDQVISGDLSVELTRPTFTQRGLRSTDKEALFRWSEWPYWRFDVNGSRYRRNKRVPFGY